MKESKKVSIVETLFYSDITGMTTNLSDEQFIQTPPLLLKKGKH